MTILQYETQVPLGGYITLPPEFYGRKVVVSADAVQDRTEKKHGTDRPPDDGWRPDPAAVRRFIESRKSLPPVEITDEEIEQLKHERRMNHLPGEQRKAAGREFFDTWDGLLEGMPDMTAKEIRAERLERKYGQ